MIWFTLPVICYLIGSLPIAVIVGRISHGIDIRETGSGNAGATNSYRALGLIPGLIVLILDILKALIPMITIKVLLEKNHLSSDLIYKELLLVLCLSFIISGHVFPVFARFKGGKAMASGAAGITALIPILAPFCLIIFLLTAFLTKYISLASLTAAWSLPVVYVLLVYLNIRDFSIVYCIYFIFIALMITLLHRKNIRSLLKGTERKISRFSK